MTHASDMIGHAIAVTDTEIIIRGEYLVHKDYYITGKEIVLDILARKYIGQHIVIRLVDGENIDFSGFELFVKSLCDIIQIPYTNVTFETHAEKLNFGFNHKKLKMGIFLSAGRLIPAEFNRDLTNARFVGTSLGRFTINRMRLAYELDTAFPGNTHIVYQPNRTFINDTLKNFDSEYQHELTWLTNKTFDKDIKSPHHMGMVNWQDACASYGNVWNKYQIEAISETDCIDNFWFTEKTANCLATGKPFVLVSGQGSLQTLRNMGFVTFGNVLDESYDQAQHPYSRIQQITAALSKLYNSPTKDKDIKELYRIADQNITLYQKYVEL